MAAESGQISSQPEQEGVIKYTLDFSPEAAQPFSMIPALNAWRTVCRRCGLIGQDPDRYDGYGFGNISSRLNPDRPPFLISGSQTGHLPVLTDADFAVVERCDVGENRVVARGALRPSSESMTHATVYQQDPAAQAVIHAHSPEIWGLADDLAIPQTAAGVPYGSPAMGDEVARLFADQRLAEKKIFVMGGHVDGVVTFGQTIDEAGFVLLQALADALKQRGGNI